MIVTPASRLDPINFCGGNDVEIFVEDEEEGAAEEEGKGRGRRASSKTE